MCGRVLWKCVGEARRKAMEVLGLMGGGIVLVWVLPIRGPDEVLGPIGEGAVEVFRLLGGGL